MKNQLRISDWESQYILLFIGIQNPIVADIWQKFPAW